MNYLVTNRHGLELKSVEDWRVHAAPASEKHWKDGRSAKELAKAWLEGSGAMDLTHLLATQPETAKLSITSATAEGQVAFDEFPGGKRNHDLLVRGHVAGGDIVVGVEAKADETFGETVEQYRAAGLTRRDTGASTNAPERLAGLLRDIAGVSDAPARRSGW